MAEVPLSRTLLRERVLSELTRAILNGTLQPGERLRDDELIAWLGTSRAPIREALDELAVIGLVEMAPNRFTRVAVISPRLYAESMAVWATLVTRALHLGIQSFPADRIGELEAINDLLIGFDSRDFPIGPTPVDLFIGVIVEYCENRVLMETIKTHDPLLQLGVNRYKGIVDAEPVREFFLDVIRRCRDNDVDGFEASIREFLAGPMRTLATDVSGYDTVGEYEEALDAGPRP